MARRKRRRKGTVKTIGGRKYVCRLVHSKRRRKR
jgi:hypothetical protein